MDDCRDIMRNDHFSSSPPINFFFFFFLPSKRGSGSGDMRTRRSDWIRIYNNTFSPLNTLQGTNCFSNQDNTVDKMTILFLFTKQVLQKIVVHLTLRSYGVNQAIRFVEGIWLHRKSRQIRLFFQNRAILHHTCATYCG